MATLLKICAFVLVMGLAMSCGIARYNECRTVHPVWYCLSSK